MHVRNSVRFDSQDVAPGRTVRRWDFAELRAPETTPEGFVRGQGYLTRHGVFKYRRADGTETAEYRPEAQVFDAASLASFNLVPLTVTHPIENLTPDTVADHQVGSVGNTDRSGEYVKADILITHRDGITAFEKGKIALSCGYNCKVTPQTGVFTDSAGVQHRFDSVQSEIRGNHVAMVDTPRAGPNARMRLDSEDAEQAGTEAHIHPGGPESNDGDRDPGDLPTVNDVDIRTLLDALSNLRIDGMPEDKKKAALAKIQAATKAHLAVDAGDKGKGQKMDEEITIGGSKFTVPGAVAKHLGTLQSESDKMAGKLAAVETVQKRMDAEKNKEDEDRRVTEKVELLAKSALILGKDVKELLRMDSDELIKAVVKQEAPEISLDKKSADFIRGIFETVTAKRVDTAEAVARLVGTAKDKAETRADESDVQSKIEKAREAMELSMQNAWDPTKRAGAGK